MQTTTVQKNKKQERRGSMGWRVALIGSGVTLLLGGPMHPDAPKDLSLRQELAVMMDDDAWIPGHSLLLVSAILLAVGLLAASKERSWPAGSHKSLRIAAAAATLYCVEAAFHLFSFVDVDRLRDGDFAPVAFTHIGLAAVLYPVSGLAIAYLAVKVIPHWSLPQRPFAVVGIVAGIAHALSVPLTFTFGDLETGPLFAFGAIGIAFFSISAGLIGIRSAVPVTTTDRAVA